MTLFAVDLRIQCPAEDPAGDAGDALEFQFQGGGGALWARLQDVACRRELEEPADVVAA
ncbi:hypothetical protein FKZ61_007830 [Litorilinea aerophila]|uniref:hypothetical protein n=1 Tax=Litorilinea aerophila TaxID=1204385 RepID=UPI0014768D55|nr:hypothetical protein [Litorilinea aerophila]MCC9076018.1 hypothetical protein [Litorilinea aerophila]